MSTATVEYVTFVGATPERVWRALTDPEESARYWDHRNVSDHQPGSRWEHRRTDADGTVDIEGRVLESEPPKQLVMDWFAPGELDTGHAERVSFELEPFRDLVRLTVTHAGCPDEAVRDEVAAAWPAILSNLKTLIETGAPLPQAPWEMRRQGHG